MALRNIVTVGDSVLSKTCRPVTKFDKRLHTGLFSKDLFNPMLHGISPIEPGRMILEVKYDRYLPDYIKRLLSTVPSDHCAISKYTLCRRFEPLGE